MKLAGCISACFLWMAPLFGNELGATRIAHLPLVFERLETANASYIARGPGYSLEVSRGENVLRFAGAPAALRLETRFLGARKNGEIGALDQLASHSNYFAGAEYDKWRTNVAQYGKVSVTGLYRGIDLMFYGNAGQLEYDFVVHSGADPRRIRFEVDGVSSPRVDSSGDLVLSAPGHEVRWKAPAIYQVADGRRIWVPGRFRVNGREVRFEIARYDDSRDLVIDPVLSYASYLGGKGNDSARGIAVDPAGNVYVAGTTTSSNLAVTATALQAGYGGQTNNDFTGDAFVAKFSPSGALIYLTYLGGKADDYAFSVAADSSGNAYVTGMTNSTDFPVTANAYQKTFAGFGGNTCERGGDAFVAKLNPTGSQLLYSTYLGGQKDDSGTSIAVDASGNAYVAGSTISGDFPTTANAFQSAFKGLGGQEGKPYCGGSPWFNTGDAFVSKLDPTGSQLLFSTYLGGTLDDLATSIALDSAQNVYVGGYTLSRNFPVTAGAYQTTFRGIEAQNEFFNTGDAFVTKFTSGGSLVYATYLGGTGDDAIFGLAPASDGSVWVTGNTSSQDFPVTADAVQSAYAGYTLLPFFTEQLFGDAFFAHLNAAGSSLLFATYLGGSQNDSGTAIAVDAAGLVYVAGFSDSLNFPFTSNALQKTMDGDGGVEQYETFGDGFVAVLDPTTSKLIYSSYLGGNRDDMLLAVAVDGQGGVWSAGNTLSTDLPVTGGAAQSGYGGMFSHPGWKGDAFLAHVTGLAPQGPTINAVVNGASFVGGGVAPGEIATIFGGTLTSSSGINLTSGLPLPTDFLNVAVNVNGTPAPLFAVDNVNGQQQINFQVPWEAAGGANATVSVTNNGATSALFSVPVVAAQPAIFAYTVGNDTFGAILHANFQLADSAHPAKAPEVVLIYCTGLGAVDSAPIDGAAGNGQKTNAKPSVTIGGLDAPVSFSGLAPGFVGLYQINAQVPSGLSAGNQSVVIKVGGASSSTVLLPVQ